MSNPISDTSLAGRLSTPIYNQLLAIRL